MVKANLLSTNPFNDLDPRSLKYKKHDAEIATDCKRFLKSLRTSNPDKLVFAHLNINSIRNKFEMLSDQIKGNIDVLLVSETKIDDSFPNGNFLIGGFSTPYRLDRNSNGGVLVIYQRRYFFKLS